MRGVREYVISRHELFGNPEGFHKFRSAVKEQLPFLGERAIYWFLGEGYFDFETEKGPLHFKVYVGEGSPAEAVPSGGFGELLAALDGGDRLLILTAWHAQDARESHGLAGDAAYLDWLEVHKDFRKRGLGSAAVRKVAEEAKAAGYGKLILDTREKNKPFYDKLGFVSCLEPSEEDVGEAEKVREYKMVANTLDVLGIRH